MYSAMPPSGIYKRAAHRSAHSRAGISLVLFVLQYSNQSSSMRNMCPSQLHRWSLIFIRIFADGVRVSSAILRPVILERILDTALFSFRFVSMRMSKSTFSQSLMVTLDSHPHLHVAIRRWRNIPQRRGRLLCLLCCSSEVPPFAATRVCSHAYPRARKS